MRRSPGQGKTDFTCQQCGKVFIAPIRWAQKFCSKTCKADSQRGSVKLIPHTCATCGSTFLARECEYRRTCSKPCQYALRRSQSDPSKRAEYTCLYCGKVFEGWAYRPARYCSHSCRGKATIKDKPWYRPATYTATCEQCGVSYQTAPYSTRGRFCSLKCFGRWLSESGVQSGKRHPNWRGGYEPYYGPSWRPARRLVRQRDKVCQDCGKSPKDNGKALDVHHMKPFREFGIDRHLEANDPSNLITLCAVCHTNREWGDNRA